jgi:micrococcal nuclease
MKKLFIIFALGLLVAGVVWLLYIRAERTPFDEGVLYRVTKVIDGDTIEVQTPEKKITIRLLGINTPETVDPRRGVECYGKEASARVKELLIGTDVTLVLDVDREVQDKYGRYLAYVYTSEGVFVNQHLLEEGYAREYTYGSAYDEQKSFRRAQTDARLNNKGLWAACGASTSN